MTVYRLGNLAFQLGGDVALIRNLRDGLGFDQPADVLMLVEARDGANRPVNVARALGRRWAVSQDRRSGATAGSVIAVRRAAVRLRWSLSRVLSRKARRVQTRYQRIGAIRPKRSKVARVAVPHIPLKSTGQQDAAVDAVARWVARQERRGKRWMVAGDFNMSHAEMCKRIGGERSWGADVMGFVVSRGWGDVGFTSSRYRGSDHAALTLTTKEK